MESTSPTNKEILSSKLSGSLINRLRIIIKNRREHTFNSNKEILSQEYSGTLIQRLRQFQGKKRSFKEDPRMIILQNKVIQLQQNCDSLQLSRMELLVNKISLLEQGDEDQEDENMEDLLAFAETMKCEIKPPVEKNQDENLKLLKCMSEKLDSKIQELNLSSTNQYKLGEQGISMLVKIELSFLSHLNLQNNRIKDEGLSTLCKKNLTELKSLKLDDNAITINGLRHTYFNNWSQEVDYGLYSVYSNDGGYHLNVGESIPIIKQHLQQGKYDASIQKHQKKKTLNAIKLLMATPLEDNEFDKLAARSKLLEENYRKQSDKNPFSLSTVLLQLKQQFSDSMFFDSKSDIKSKLTSKILFNNLNSERVAFSLKLDGAPFDFSSFKDNAKSLKDFEKWYFQYMRNVYEVDSSEITLDKVVKGSTIPYGSDSIQNALTKNKMFFAHIEKDIKDFFGILKLSEEEFDQKGNYKFPKIQKAEIQYRAGFVYFQPVLAIRFGIKVKGLYDGGLNNWLKMQHCQGQWAIGFHGIRNPTRAFKDKLNTLRSIMDGRESGQMLIAGSGQVYQNDDCLNIPNTKVGKGVYLSPYFTASLLDYTFPPTDKFHVLLQCRVRPNSIKITQKPEYWVVNDSLDIRPYGIVLFSQENVLKLLQLNTNSNILHKLIYKEEFTKQTWKNKYEQIYNKFHGIS